MPNALTTSPASIAPAVPEQNAWLDRPVEAGTYTALYLLKEEAFHDVYSPEERADISSRVKVHPRLLTPEAYEASTEVWPEIEMIFSGWGMVVADEAFFERFPRLKMIFYAAGTVRCFVTDALWRRNVQLTNAGAANAIPVCEYTLSQILFALKHGWQKALYIRRHHAFPPRYHAPGAYRSTVGLLSLGEIGRLVAAELQRHDLNVVAYDPYVSAEEAARLNVTLLPLAEVFAVADVVSCHTPLLEETRGMIRGAHFEAMKRGATFINTARGKVVAEAELIAVLRRRPDLFALLDVTQQEEPPPHSPLYALDNVLLTPHIAGSLGRECHRMGRLMAEELDRYLAGEPLRYAIDEERFKRLA